MKTGLQLSQQLNMKLMLKPELQQSLHMLQLSSYDLMQYLNEQAVENPVLEIEAPISSFREMRKSTRKTGGEAYPLGGVQAKKETLEHALLSQLRIARVPSNVYKVAAFLAGNLNDAGYLDISIPETAALLKEPIELVEEALRAIQSLEPTGVGAQNLKECLLLQIQRDPLAKPCAYETVNLYLQLLAQGKFDKIAFQLGISQDEVKQIAAYIRGLNPRPGSACSQEELHYVMPDAFVYKREGNRVIRLNAAAVPTLTLNHEWETVPFMKERMKSAMSILHGLKQRQVTLYRVIDAIFGEQAAFLDEGEKALKPLTMRVISEKLHIHESTVSRAVQNKFVKTQFGVYELKHFFSSAISTHVGDYASGKQVKLRVRELISRENKRHPLSDQKIVTILNQEGIHISRRTVTKYREELNLLSSALRKKMEG